MKLTSWMLLGSVLGLLGALVPGCGDTSRVCGPSNCAGCCDPRGTCELGAAQDACGAGGAACVACEATQSCRDRSCVSGSEGEDGGPGADAGPGSDGGVLSIDEFTEADLRAACEVWVRCGYVSSIDACSGWYLDRFRAFRASTVKDEQAAVEAGRMLFHPDRARACLEAIQSAACPDHARGLSLPECAHVFEGQVPTHGSCYTAEECGVSDWCTSSGSTCPGQCEPRRTEAQTLDPSKHEACADGLYPYYLGDGTYLCRTPAGLGSSCARISQSGDPQRCVDSAWCDPVTQECLVKKAAGAACGGDIECASGLVCQSGTCGPLAAPGESCSTNPETQCQDDLTCFRSAPGTTVGTCSARGGAGASCSNVITGCLPGLYCAGYRYSPASNGSCTAYKAPGASCADHQECGPSAYCSTSGACTALAPDGAACTEGQECLGGLCNSGTCTSYFCHAPTP